jgi:hypothetical protein
MNFLERFLKRFSDWCDKNPFTSTVIIYIAYMVGVIMLVYFLEFIGIAIKG